jgi:hypothetical protein
VGTAQRLVLTVQRLPEATDCTGPQKHEHTHCIDGTQHAAAQPSLAVPDPFPRLGLVLPDADMQALVDLFVSVQASVNGQPSLSLLMDS